MVVGDQRQIELRLTLGELLDSQPPLSSANALLAFGGAEYNSEPVALDAEDLTALEPRNARGDHVASLLRGTDWERGFWNLSWLKGSDVYTKEKWEEDQRRLESFYLDHGHVLASVGEPAASFADGEIGLFRKKPVKWVDLKVPVTEGAAFRVGSLGFSGLTVFDEAQVRPLFALSEGELYRESRVSKGYERLREAYGARGFPFMTGRTQRSTDDARDVVDVVIAVDEDKLYHVGRIRFTGNDSTRDSVLRREVFLNEGDVVKVDTRSGEYLGRVATG